MLMNKILRYSFVALMAMVFGSVWAGEPTKVLTFPATGGEDVSSYTKEWTATVGTDEWILNGFNSNKNQWAFVRCGRKTTAQTASITSPAVNVAITDYVISVNKTSNVSKATLKVGDADAIDITDKFVAGDVDIKVTHNAGEKFVLTIDSDDKASANGPTEISKVALYAAGQYAEVHIENTEETAYTVAEAIAIIDKGEALSETVFVKGKVSQVDSYNDTYKSITYWISDDGTTTTQLEVYSGKGLEGADFASVDDVKVGASVIIKGILKKYGEVYEFDKNNQLVKYEYGQTEGTVYSWESPEGTAAETGGTATFEMGDEGENRVNYKNTAGGVDYYTLCLNGNKANIEDETYTKGKSERIKVTLEKALAGGETISVTAYTNKGDESKISTPYFKFSNGTELFDDSKTYIDLGISTNTAPVTQTYTIPAEAAGSTSFKMSRSKTGTNLFITKFVITSGGSTGINTVKTVRVADGAIYNLAGQKVDKSYKGVVIMNGKKMIQK